jgi:hypothetical protein
MTLHDALAAALDRIEHDLWMRGSSLNASDLSVVAAAVLADPAFREALTAALGEALDAEEEAVGFTVYEAWPTAAAILARLLPVEEDTDG